MKDLEQKNQHLIEETNMLKQSV